LSPNTSEDRKSHRFSTSVASDDTEELTATAQADATVEQVAVRFYSGPRLDLHVKPFIRRQVTPNRTTTEDVVELHGKEYIDGNDDLWVFDVSKTVEEDDEFGVEVTNTDTDGNDYDFVADMELDRAGGPNRPFSGLIDTIKGWF